MNEIYRITRELSLPNTGDRTQSFDIGTSLLDFAYSGERLISVSENLNQGVVADFDDSAKTVNLRGLSQASVTLIRNQLVGSSNRLLSLYVRDTNNPLHVAAGTPTALVGVTGFTLTSSESFVGDIGEGVLNISGDLSGLNATTHADGTLVNQYHMAFVTADVPTGRREVYRIYTGTGSGLTLVSSRIDNGVLTNFTYHLLANSHNFIMVEADEFLHSPDTGDIVARHLIEVAPVGISSETSITTKPGRFDNNGNPI